MINFQTINHHDYTVSERENLSRLMHIDAKIPHVYLHTCNRTEVYWGDKEISENTARHLFRVASGLESGLIGERAIQGQLKNAYQTACGEYKLSSHLHKLFQTAIHTGKRVRTETHISEGAMSHSLATIQILKDRHIDLNKKTVSIIGVNKLTEDIFKYLKSQGAKHLFLSNRNYNKAIDIAQKYGSEVIPFGEKKSLLQQTDVLICATSAPHLIINTEDIEESKSLIIFDLAFPRDVDPLLKGRAGIELLNLDDIEQTVQSNIRLREKEVKQAEIIINQEIENLKEWQRQAVLHQTTVI